MDARQHFTRLTYDDFQPAFEWSREEGAEVLSISLPGFQREQLNANIDSFGKLKVSGERPLSNSHWSRFRSEFPIPNNTSTADIRAQFDGENLRIMFPKLFAELPPAQVHEHVSDKKTTAELKTREDQKDDRMKPSNEQSRINAAITESGKKERNLAESRKRKADMQGGSIINGESAGKAGVGLDISRFKRPTMLLLNAGVAALVLTGLALHLSYKIRKTVEPGSN